MRPRRLAKSLGKPLVPSLLRFIISKPELKPSAPRTHSATLDKIAILPGDPVAAQPGTPKYSALATIVPSATVIAKTNSSAKNETSGRLRKTQNPSIAKGKTTGPTQNASSA